jgi:hypothetical protein
VLETLVEPDVVYSVRMTMHRRFKHMHST